jgi:hypothetical protein
MPKPAGLRDEVLRTALAISVGEIYSHTRRLDEETTAMLKRVMIPLNS